MTDRTTESEFLKAVNNRINENRTEMLSSLSKLISIPSVAVESEDAKAGMPFGEEVDKAYRLMLKMGEDEGFTVFDADGYGGHIDYDGTEDGVLGVIGHLDVVPEGEGWDFEPYGGQVIDGYVCGRGASDDKGPVVASFYAMKALKECGFEPARTIRLIIGLDEETYWNGMKYYLEHTPDLPDIGFSPDGNFPVIRGEMGILIFEIITKFPKSRGKGLELSSLAGGTAPNAVPDFAKAVLNDTTGGKYELIREAAENCAEESGWDIKTRRIGKGLEISVNGKAAHGSRPEEGVNAVSILMDFLGRQTFLNDGVADFVRFYNDRIGYDLHGERIGCAFEDEDSGKLIFNVGKIEADKNSARITVNIRYPLTSSADQVYAGIMEILDGYGYGIVKVNEKRPINIDPESEVVSTLMRVYKKHTGDVQSEPIVMSGGTYARAFENTVAFGSRFPNEPNLAHKKNEKISEENLMRLAQMYAEAVYELAKAED